MANWLIDYIEMTEYIPNELREQLTSIRELDLKVHNAMDELERDVKQFFSKMNTLSPIERQSQYDAFLKKCDVATQAAGDKVKVADRLHDLVEKSMRLLDQGLEKLKEDLLEGDKAYIVEDIERRSQELDQQLRLEQEQLKQRHQQQSHRSKTTTHSKGHRSSVSSNFSSTNSNHHNHHHNHHHHYHHNHHHNHHNHPHLNNHHHRSNNHHNLNNHSQHHNSSTTSSSNHHNHAHHHIQSHSATHARQRHNSTGTASTSHQQNNIGRQKKRDKKRLSNSMTIFNRNSRTDDDSTNQTYLSSPSTPDHLAGLQNSSSNSFTDNTGCGPSINGNNGLNTLKSMIANNNVGGGDGFSSAIDPLSKASQPILTAIDAAHAVSPNATNSDKLVLFSSNANSDTHTKNLYVNNTLSTDVRKPAPSLTQQQQIGMPTTFDIASQRSDNKSTNTNGTGVAAAARHNMSSQLGGHLLPSAGSISTNGTSSKAIQLNGAIAKELHQQNYDQVCHNNFNHDDNSNQFISSSNTTSIVQNHNNSGGVFSSMPALSARQDPIMLAASQAINATQNMAPGRRTSSLKASYAAVNSGRLQTTPASSATSTAGSLGATVTSNDYIIDQSSSMTPNETYCKCRGGILDPNMIACDNRDCKIEWFHWQCVGITTPPEGEWYCDDCRHSLGRQSKANLSGNKQSRASGLASSAS